ncbi:putative glycosyl transferase, group 1 [Salinisphaera sp. PC39]|uniref:glycosyltransferase family 4 protein n=1 Tax=Salinisphaera sp. PC39 TaxID=1304156 RepID=UPI0033413EBE
MSRGPFLFVESYPQVIAGQQRTLLALLDAAGGLDRRCVTVVPGEGPMPARLRELGHEVVVWPQPALLDRYGGAVYRDSVLTRLKVLWQVFSYVVRLWRELGRLRPTAIYCNDMRGLLTVGIAAGLRRIPVMTWDKLDKPHGLLDWFQLPLVTLNLVISRAVTVKYPAWQRRLFRRRIRVVPNGVDIEAIDGAQAADLGLPADDNKGLLVGMVGTVTPRKGQDRLLAVWPRLLEVCPDARLVLVGAPESDEDRQWAEGLPNRDHPSVTWLGHRDDVPAVMHALDLLVVPSRHEGMGRVCAEAMAAGTTVLGARTGGIPEVVAENETGLLFEPEDAEDLSAKLQRLCIDAGLRRRLGDAGRLRAKEHFDQRKQHRMVLALLRDI